jgi:hypothetical protein
MAPNFYSQRNGEYVYDVSVTRDESVSLAQRYRAHLSNVQRLEGGRLTQVQVDVQDTHGATVTEALRALDASFDSWRQEHLPNHQ